MHNLLDHGYLRKVNVMGTDLDVVNAARVSFDKEGSLPLEERDEKLIHFLVKNKHDSTLRHCAITFEVYAPLMVARQWYKHVIASGHSDDQFGWNESSRRYITEKEEFYIPHVSEWRSAPENKKQGSGDKLPDTIGAKYTQNLYLLTKQSHDLYQEALKDGVAPEQARLLLPAYSMYVRWRWTASLNAVLHFCSLRIANDAQYEIQSYANAVFCDVVESFPITTMAWMRYRI
jgi:thymidylate synthase (FAD)